MGALYALVALGLVVVNKATGIINFAQGEFFMFSGFSFSPIFFSFSFTLKPILERQA